MFDHYFFGQDGYLYRYDGDDTLAVGDPMPDIYNYSKCFLCGIQALLWSVALKDSKHSFGIAICKDCFKIQEDKNNVR